MATVTKPYGDFTNNVDVADATKVNAQMNTIYNAVNGQLDLTNLSSSAYSQTKSADKLVQWDTNSMVQSFLNVLSGGYKVQSGTSQYPNQTYNANVYNHLAVNFPVAFANTPIVMICLNGLASQSSWMILDAESITPTGFQAVMATGISFTSAMPFTWIAIGS